MRILRPMAATAALAAACAIPAGELRAQSFLQQIFKSFTAEPAPQQRQKRASSPSKKSHVIKTQPIFGYGGKSARKSPLTPADLYSSRRPTGSYKTVCVRMCDGFYWPVSSSTRRSGFHRDALTCTSSCDSEARLFYLPRSSRSVKGMRDLTGRVYDHTPNAYVYRKRLVDGCTCKPAPWARRERARHARYAWAEEMKKMDAKARAEMAQAEVLAGSGALQADVVAGAPDENAAKEHGSERTAQVLAGHEQPIEKTTTGEQVASLTTDPGTLAPGMATDNERAADSIAGPLNNAPATTNATAAQSYAALIPETEEALTPNPALSVTSTAYVHPQSTRKSDEDEHQPQSTAEDAKKFNKAKKPKKKRKPKKVANKQKKSKPSFALGGLFGGGNNNYKWPGD